MTSILLDAGHGQGRDFNRGYKGSKWKNEGDSNYYFSLLLMAELKKYGFSVSQTRTSISQNPSLSSRGSQGAGHDLFISLHTNAGGGKGVEIYEDVNRRTSGLAGKLCDTISKTLGIVNRGVKHRYYAGDDYYGVLRSNRAKAGMLIEHCFHDNKAEIEKYENNAQALAINMASTIANHYGLGGNRQASVSTNSNSNKGGMTMLGNKAVAIISFVNDGDITSGAVSEVVNYLFPDYNPVITKSGKFDYGNIKTNYIIAVGGDLKQHSGYCNYFISGKDAAETLQKAKDFRKNKNKYLIKR